LPREDASRVFVAPDKKAAAALAERVASLLTTGDLRAVDLELSGEAPKSQAGRRTLALPTALAALLTDHLARRRLTGADSDALVFLSKQGGLTLAVFAQATSEADRAAADALGRRFLDARAMNAP
jgi:hypothetical protein